AGSTGFGWRWWQPGVGSMACHPPRMWRNYAPGGVEINRPTVNCRSARYRPARDRFALLAMRGRMSLSCRTGRQTSTGRAFRAAGSEKAPFVFGGARGIIAVQRIRRGGTSGVALFLLSVVG